MKTTIVPAQVTTVEDKIAGNLSVVQLFLLALPIFLNGALFVILPPMMKVTAFKVLLGLLVFVVSATLAIRIKGKILLTWFLILVGYNTRPRYYVFNKNSSYLRDPGLKTKPAKVTQRVIAKKEKQAKLPHITIPEMVRLEAALADTRSNFRLEANKRGGLNVRITEIK